MRGSQLVPAGKAAICSISRSASSIPATKLNWKQDTVYLYQFPRSPVVPNLSPYCLKVETFLRIKNIKYEVIETSFKRSARGRLPFVELNGEQIPDSHLIITRLAKHFDAQDTLSREERAVGRAVDAMLDSSTLWALQPDRIVNNSDKFASRAVSGMPLPGFVTNLLGKRMAGVMEGRMRQALGKESNDEIKERLKNDLEAIDALIGNKRFLFGPVPSAVDCSIFGHIASAYFLPYRQALSDFIDDDFSSLKGHLFRIREHYYPEWKERH